MEINRPLAHVKLIAVKDEPLMARARAQKIKYNSLDLINLVMKLLL